MITILAALVSLLSFRVRSRAHLELELIGPSTSGERPGAPAPRSDSALLDGSTSLGLALPGLAASPQCHGAGQAGNRGPSGKAQDEHRDPRSDPPDEPRQPALGRAPHPRRTAQARHRSQPGHTQSGDTCRGDPKSPPRPGVASYTTT